MDIFDHVCDIDFLIKASTSVCINWVFHQKLACEDSQANWFHSFWEILPSGLTGRFRLKFDGKLAFSLSHFWNNNNNYYQSHQINSDIEVQIMRLIAFSVFYLLKMSHYEVLDKLLKNVLCYRQEQTNGELCEPFKLSKLSIQLLIILIHFFKLTRWHKLQTWHTLK